MPMDNSERKIITMLSTLDSECRAALVENLRISMDLEQAMLQLKAEREKIVATGKPWKLTQEKIFCVLAASNINIANDNEIAVAAE